MNTSGQDASIRFPSLFCSSLLALAVACIGMWTGAASAAQWTWKVKQVRGPNGAITAGSSTVYSTKAAALAAMRQMIPPYGAPLTYEQPVAAVSSGRTTYAYSYAPKNPDYSPWQYYANYHVTIGSWGTIAGPFGSEADAIASLEQWRTTTAVPGPGCEAPTLTEIGGVGWTNPNPQYNPWGNTDELHDFQLNYAPCESGFYQYDMAAITRARTITCSVGPAGLQYNLSLITEPFCTQGGGNGAMVWGWIEGNLLECPSVDASPPSVVGDPCDAATGDFFTTERDYDATGLQFTRTYHSATLESHHRLGVGWTHNYAGYLKPPALGSSYVGLVRPDGHIEGLYLHGSVYRSQAGSGIEASTSFGIWTVYLRDGSREVYDTQARLKQMVDAAGRVTTLNYLNGRLATVVGPNGHTLGFAYDSDGLIQSVTEPSGNQIVYGYDAANNLVVVTYPGGSSRQYHYEDVAFPNHLTGITDETAERFNTIEYDSVGRVTASWQAGGVNRVDIVYGATTSTVTDASGAVTTFTYSGASWETPRLRSASKNGLTETYFLDSSPVRALYKLRNARGHDTYFDRDAGQRPWRVIEAYGTPRARTTELEYLTPGARLVTTERLRDTTGTLLRLKEISYNPQHLPETISLTGYAPDGTPTTRTTTRTYDSSGRVQSVDGPRTDVLDVTTYAYYNCTTGYQCGEVHTITNALSHVATYNTYNAHGQPLTITDPNGVVTTLTYDLRQRLTSRTVGTEQTTFEYWPTGLLKKVTLPDNSFLQYTYDDAHRLAQIADADGNRIVYTLDAMGNRTAEQFYDASNALTQTRTRVFNTLNQLWKEIGAAGTANVTTTLSYDNSGNQTNINAPLGRIAVQTYDELNRLKQVTDPLSGVTQYGYDALDELVSVTDPRGQVTTYTYNGLGDLKQQASPDTGTTTNTYDSGGNLATSMDARSKTGTYAYDALNRVTSVTYLDQTISYSYDTGTNQKGRLTQVTDASGFTSWSYDAHGRVLSRQQSMGVTKTRSYAYDTAGRLQTLTLPSGNTITYGYSDGKIASLTLNGSTTILSNVLYQPFGAVRGWTWGNSTLTIRNYDTDGRVSDIDSAGLKTYSYDDAFRITAITDAENSSLSQSYGYDLLDRLTSATDTSLNQGWTFDANGNRLTQTGSAASTYTISSTSNRLNNISGALTRAYSYDNSGNTTSDGTATLTYNDAGRMVSAMKASVITTYAFNALGQRVKKTTSGSSTYFVYDEAGHLTGEYDNSGNLIQETVWLYDTPVATLRPNGGGVDIFYVHTDHLNTPRRITRPSDNIVVWRWDSDPFGTTTASEDPDGNSNLFVYGLRFPGQYFNSETGLYYNYMRDLDPQTGRYVQSDPIGLRGGLNTYAYVGGNPISSSDPTGLESSGCCTQSFGDCFNKCMQDRLGPLADYALNLTALGTFYGIASTPARIGVPGVLTANTNLATAVGGDVGRGIGRAVAGRVGGRIGLGLGIRAGLGTWAGLGIAGAGLGGWAIGSAIYCTAVCTQDHCYY